MRGFPNSDSFISMSLPFSPADRATQSELDTWLQGMSQYHTVEVLVADINGVLRGKRIPRDELASLFAGNMKGTASTSILKISGDLADNLGFGHHDGDPDRWLYPVQGTLVPAPWLGSNTAQVLTSLVEADGCASLFDSRQILRQVQRRLESRGIRVVVATELEFYLVEQDQDGRLRPRLPGVAGTGLRQQGTQFSSMEDLWELDGFLQALREAGAQQRLPLTTVHSEFAQGQLEVNLQHIDDALTACDQAILLKRLVKGLAWQQDMTASFMAKPFTGLAGSGMHIHVSLYDEDGNNLFVQPDCQTQPPVSETMRQAVGGLQQLMADSMALFAPNANSYRRYCRDHFAPLSPLWGYNHRDMALRVPLSDRQNLRIEHRVAGADANPYLVVAAVLAGIDHGLANQCQPTAMVPEGKDIGDPPRSLPNRWDRALESFAASKILADYLGSEYHRIYSQVKREENDEYHAQINPLDYQWYLRTV